MDGAGWPVPQQEEKFEPRILKVDEDLTLMFVVHIGDQVEVLAESTFNAPTTSCKPSLPTIAACKARLET
eukprot:5875712-Amphidinium_carterae.1